MTTTDNIQTLSLETVHAVWAIELKDIDDRMIGGHNPNSRMNKVDETFVKIEKFTGVDKSGLPMFFGAMGKLTGTTGLIMAGVALAVGLDLKDDQKVLKNAEFTEKLLALSSRPISSVDWDALTSLIGNIENWLVPILAKRIESLVEILQINSNPLAKERFDTYVKAVEELEVALATLKIVEKEFNNKWAHELEIYNKQAQKVRDDYEAEKRQLALENEALLIDKATFMGKSRDIEEAYASKACAKFGCKNISASDSSYCFHHKCFSPLGCTNPVANDLHYCEEHVQNLADVELQLPSLNPKVKDVSNNHMNELASTEKTEGKNSGWLSAVTIVACLVSIPLFAKYFLMPLDPSIADHSTKSVQQHTISYENLSIEDLKSLMNKSISDIDNANDAVASLEKEINALSPSLKGGSEKQTIQIAENLLRLAIEARDKVALQVQEVNKMLAGTAEMTRRGALPEKILLDGQNDLMAVLNAANNDLNRRNDSIDAMRSSLSNMYASHNTNTGSDTSQNIYQPAANKTSEEKRSNAESATEASNRTVTEVQRACSGTGDAGAGECYKAMVDNKAAAKRLYNDIDKQQEARSQHQREVMQDEQLRQQVRQQGY